MSENGVENGISQFDSMFPDIEKSLYSSLPPELSTVIKYFHEVAEYNVPHGKRFRGRTVVSTFKALCDDENADDLKRACIAGWCIEWLQAAFLVHDDIVDEGKYRRGQLCWYLKQQESHGMIAVNDGLHLAFCVMQILKTYFREQPYYADLVDLFQECAFNTCLGQGMDLLTSPKEKIYDEYTEERYMTIVRWKTAYYSFYLPVASGMIIAGIKDEKKYEIVKKIMLSMGDYFQIQDDYLDCYGDPEVTGKVGTDIEEGKCSWLIVQALKYASEEQKRQLKENYGINDPNKVEKIKAIYWDLELQQKFFQYENSTYNDLMAIIKNSCATVGLPESLFTELINKIFKRKK